MRLKRIKDDKHSNNNKNEFSHHIGQKITLHIAILFFMVLAIGGSSIIVARAISFTTINVVRLTEHIEIIEAIHRDVHQLFTELHRAVILRTLDRSDDISQMRKELDHHIRTFLELHRHEQEHSKEMTIFREIQHIVMTLDPLIDTILRNAMEGNLPNTSDEEKIDAIARRIPRLTKDLNELHHRSIIQMLDYNKERMKYITWAYLFLLIGGGILLILGNELFSRKIALPLTRLAEATKKVAEGDYKLRVQVASSDEIGLLSHTFNLMAERLEIQDRMGKDFQQKLEQTVRERTKELEDANRILKDTQTQMIQLEKLRVIGEIYAGLTHEINNPLAVIISKNRMLMDEAQEMNLPAEMIRELEAIGRHGSRIAEIIRGLLTFARQEPFEICPLDLNAMIIETVTLVEKVFSRLGIVIEKELLPNLPKIQGSWNHLQQVFFNLLSNARDALPEGGTITIHSYQTERSGEVMVDVIDNGIGIAPENISKIFDPFFTTKETGKGTGLGLSVSYGIVKSHSGDIEVTSESGKGSCFTLSFPSIINP